MNDVAKSKHIVVDAYNLSKVLKDEFDKILLNGYKSTVKYFPIEDGCSIFDVSFSVNDSGPLRFDNTLYDNAGSVLSKIPQHAFGGDLNNIKFGGINIIAEGDRVIFIKGSDLSKK